MIVTTTTIPERGCGCCGHAHPDLATAIREQRCMICLTAGDGPLVRVRIIRRADAARRRALVCEGCVPKAPPRYAVLRLIDGEAA
jgi:hypothetical protein